MKSAVKMFGYRSPQDAVGRDFDQWGRKGKIIGVMKDFHFKSLQEEIKPLSMRIEPNGCDLVSVKVSANNLPATISAIEKKWNTLIPARPFSYFFLDEFFDKQYQSEQRFGKLFLNFAILAIIISCLGLLGLASYSTMQRTREIGIRKVLGATVPNIVNLLIKGFFKTGCRCHCDCFSHCLVRRCTNGCRILLTGFRFPGGSLSLAAVTATHYRSDYGKFSGDQSSGFESGSTVCDQNKVNARA